MAPCGYRIENGIAVIDEKKAAKIKKLFINYIQGMSLKDAAQKAGISHCHATVSRIISNRKYTGDGYYPQIIDEGRESKDWIDERMEELQKELIRLAKEKEDYSEVALEIQRLREIKKNYLSDKGDIEAKKERLVEVDEFLKEQSTRIEEYDDYLVRRFIDKVTVYDDRICVELKNGVEVCIR